jgi:hypothetical protein
MERRQYMKSAMHIALVHACASLGPVRDQRPAGQAARVDSGRCLQYLLAVHSADSDHYACASLCEAAQRYGDNLWA